MPIPIEESVPVSRLSQIEVKRTNAKKLAKALGWFSIALGAAELLVPRKVANVAGINGQGSTKWIRAYGFREVASGIGILASGQCSEAIWSRVAGDAMDLVSLGRSFGGENADKRRLAFATANVGAVTALDVICAAKLRRSAVRI